MSPEPSRDGFPLIDQAARGTGVSPFQQRSLLFQRDFALVWWSQVIAQVGDGVTRLALLWFVYAVTGSPLKTTIIGVLQTIPPILFGPFIGVLVDRVPKKPLLITTDVIRAFLIGLIPCWMSPQAFTVEVLYVLVFCNALATAVFGPALFSAVPFIVGRPKLTAADALLQSTTSFGVIGGPALSGAGIALFSSQEVLCFNAFTYLGSAAFLLFVRLPRRPAAARRERSWRSPLRDLADGIRFVVRTQPIILLLVLTAGFYSFAVSAFHMLLPVFGKRLFSLGPLEVGYLTSALGLGLLSASLGLVLVTEWAVWRRIRLLAFSSMLSAGALWSLLGVTDGMLAAVFILLIGMGNGVLVPVELGILQEVSPPELIGRVIGLYGTAAMLAAIAGMLTMGWVSERYGDLASLIGLGTMLAATALVAWSVSRRVRSMSPRSCR